MKKHDLFFLGFLIGQVLFFYQQGYTVFETVSGSMFDSLNYILLIFYCAPITGLILVNMGNFKSRVVEYGQLTLTRGKKRNDFFGKYCCEVAFKTVILNGLQFLLYFVFLVHISGELSKTVLSMLGYTLISFDVLLLQCFVEMFAESHMAVLLMSIYVYFSLLINVFLNLSENSSFFIRFFFFPGFLYESNNNILNEPQCFFIFFAILTTFLLFVSIRRLNKMDIIR